MSSVSGMAFGLIRFNVLSSILVPPANKPTFGNAEIISSMISVTKRANFLILPNVVTANDNFFHKKEI